MMGTAWHGPPGFVARRSRLAGLDNSDRRRIEHIQKKWKPVFASEDATRKPAPTRATRGDPMKASLQPGVSRVSRITIDRGRTISFMGEEGRVYATPWMIGDIEYTCRDLILEHADAGEDSVGVEVVVKHLAPTLPGMTVEIMVRVAAVEGRKITLEAVAKDELDRRPRHPYAFRRRRRQDHRASRGQG